MLSLSARPSPKPTRQLIISNNQTIQFPKNYPFLTPLPSQAPLSLSIFSFIVGPLTSIKSVPHRHQLIFPHPVQVSPETLRIIIILQPITPIPSVCAVIEIRNRIRNAQEDLHPVAGLVQRLGSVLLFRGEPRSVSAAICLLGREREKVGSEDCTVGPSPRLLNPLRTSRGFSLASRLVNNARRRALRSPVCPPSVFILSNLQRQKKL